MTVNYRLNIHYIQLEEVIPNIGLYRDDGLAVSSGTNRQTEIIKKKICKVFEKNKLSVTIEANSKIVNFLDVTLDLTNDTYKPYMKDNDAPLYVNAESNHPPTVLKGIPNGINSRLSRISANKDIFDAAAPPYQEALAKSGFNHKLTFQPPKDFSTKKKNRKRNITWFNPPYSSSVSTNIGQEFLGLLDKAFPPSNPLHKIFTRNTIKISYKCMPNMGQAVKRHNAKVLKVEQLPVAQQPNCKCSGGVDKCPVQGKCESKCVVYRATVTETATGKSETYTAVTANTFKQRLAGHKTDTNYLRYRHNTTLSDHIWSLKEQDKEYDLKWMLIDRGKAFNPIQKKCQICLKEKFHIMYNRSGASLNRREEVFNTCRHRKQNLLSNLKS